MWDYIKRLLNSFFGTRTFPPARYLTTAEIAKNIPNGDFVALGQFLVRNITWDADKTYPQDDFKATLLTLAEGHGDCEDFAMVAQEVLNYWGIQDNYILGVMGPSSGHAVSIFRTAPGMQWQMYTNGVYKKGPMSFKDVPEWVAKDTGYRTIDYWSIYSLGANNQVDTVNPVDTEEERKTLIERLG